MYYDIERVRCAAPCGAIQNPAPARAVLRIPHRPEREKLNRENSAGGATGTAEIRPCTRSAAYLFGNQRNLCGATGGHQQGRRDRQQDGQLVPAPPVSMRTVQSTLAYPRHSRYHFINLEVTTARPTQNRTNSSFRHSSARSSNFFKSHSTLYSCCGDHGRENVHLA